MLITREERNLLVRVGRHLREAIEAEERGEGSTPLRDRLLRDERDFQALRKRLETALPPAPVVIGGPVAPPPAVIATQGGSNG